MDPVTTETLLKLADEALRAGEALIRQYNREHREGCVWPLRDWLYAFLGLKHTCGHATLRDHVWGILGALSAAKHELEQMARLLHPTWVMRCGGRAEVHVDRAIAEIAAFPPEMEEEVDALATTVQVLSNDLTRYLDTYQQ